MSRGLPILDICADAGLNHFSAVITAKYKDTGLDAYPDIRAKAPAFFSRLPSRDGSRTAPTRHAEALQYRPRQPEV